MPDLEETIDSSFRKVKSLLARNGGVNEENTKGALIDPVLQVLGWDIHDLDEMQREYRYKGKGNPVDYALFIGGTPKMFLEAKPLGANLRDLKWRAQVVNYANNAGVEWCVLTDGNTWHVYKSNAPGDLDRKLFLETWLHSPKGGTPPFQPAYVLGLLSKAKLMENEIAALWKALHVDRTAERALVTMMQEKDASLVRLLMKRTDLGKRDIDAWLDRAQVTIETSIERPPALTEPPGEHRPPKPKRQPKGKGKTPLVPGLPPQSAVELPLLRAILKRGGSISVKQQGAEIDRELAAELGVTDAQQAVTLGNSKQTVWSNRVRWTRMDLVNKGELDGSTYGVWAVTEKGRERLLAAG